MTSAGVWKAICRCLGRKINCFGNDPDTPVGSTLTSSFYTPGTIPVANWNINMSTSVYIPSSTSTLAWPYGGFSTKVMIDGKVRGGGKTGGEWTEVCGMSASKYGGNLYQFPQQQWNYPYPAGSSGGLGQQGGLMGTTSITSPGTIPGANSTQFYPPLLGAAPEDAGAPVQVPDSEPSEGAL